MSQKLARLGIKAIVLEDKPEGDDYSMIVIKKDSVLKSFLQKSNLSVTNGDIIPKLWDRFGKSVATASIGPAGEQRLTAASIHFADPKGHAGRAAGRGGLGAVMGSKKIKAIVVDDKGTDRLALNDPDAFKAANKKWSNLLTSHPVSGQGLPGFGHGCSGECSINEAGALPTKNFREGRFDHAKDISGETMSENIEKRGGIVAEGCHPGCVIKCSQTYHDKDNNFLTSGFEYETIWAFGAHCLIKDLDDIAMMDRLCDDLGLDTIDTGVAMGVAMEGGLIPWGGRKSSH